MVAPWAGAGMVAWLVRGVTASELKKGADDTGPYNNLKQL